jgi:hypothetical protein
MKKLDRLLASTKLQEYITYYSEHPQKSVWKDLLLFTEFNVLKKIWLSRDDNDYKYVSTSINQAFEYYQASQQCSIKTKPLLLYYCFLNLTRGILFVKTDQAPNSSYHGLAKPQMDKNILNTSAVSYDGLFKDLLSFYNFSCPNATKFSFKDFIEGIPELTYELKTYFDIDSKLYNLDVKHYIGGDIEIRLPIEIYNSSTSFQRLSNDFNKTENDSEIIFSRNAEVNINSEALLIKNIDLIKKYCVLSPLEYSYYFNKSDNPLPIEASYYGAMFLLSSIVRYYPIDIATYTMERGENSAAWFINHFCDTASRVYPNLMLNSLMNTQIRYE